MDYEVIPYSPTENSKTAQVKKLTQFLDVLMSSPNIDQRKLTSHLLDVLEIGKDVMITEEELQAQQEQQMAVQEQVGAAAEQLPPPGADTIATGGMPEDVSPIPTDAISGMAGGAGYATPEV